MVLHRDYKGVVTERRARVKFRNEKDGKYSVHYEDHEEDGQCFSWLVKDGKRKYHLREDIVVACFSRVKDLENFNEVMGTLPIQGRLNIAHRYGGGGGGGP